MRISLGLHGKGCPIFASRQSEMHGAGTEDCA
jgi:hypothetical protein